MAHRSSFPGNHEIIEIQDDDLLSPEHFRGSNHQMKSDLRTEEGDRRSLTSNRGRVSSLEDDLTQLFDIFNRRASSQSAGSLRQNGTGSSKKSASKRRNGASGTSSPNGFGIAERVNLKQALRGLSISQASEMAALKRSTKQAGSSEAGRITTMYRNVVAEEKTSTPQGETNKGLPEISLAPENSDKSLHATPRSSMVVPDPPASNHNTSLERGVAPVSVNQRERVPESSKVRGDTPKMKLQSKEKSSPLSSSSLNPDNHSDQKSGRSSLVQNIKTSTSSDARSRSSLVEISARERLPSATEILTPTVGDNMQKGARSSLREGALFSTPDGFPGKTSLSNLSTKEKSTSVPSGSHSIADSNDLEVGNSMTSRMELFQASRPSSGPGFKTLKLDALQKEELQPPLSPSTPYRTDLSGNRSWENSKRIPGSKEQPTKVEDRGSPVRGGQMGYPVAASSNKGNSETESKATKRVLRLVKPVMRTKNFVKRKTKKGAKTPSHGSIDITHSEFNNALYPGTSHIVCPRCQCVLNEAWEEVEPKDGDSLSSPPVSPTTDLSPSTAFASPSAEVSPLSHSGSLKGETSSDYVFSDSGTPSHRMDDVRKTQEVDGPTRGGKNPKSRDKSEFTQSSKSSPDECSTSTSNSEESNLSRPSCCDRPHMSKDVRWLAIRQVRMEHGTVGLRHFNLLKKLGCGDIGTVYLAELLGTNCLFAIKVMDNDFLARRKKITRAQTERQILRMLDHPFLPTLYCQFTSDNLSCLAMEYCPGGDLHVLRQRQSGRCFSEQAARFYVAEVLLALEYLHMLGVIYRDLKPENILVREDGHIMLSDFDLSLRCAVSPTLLVSPSITETAKTGDTVSTSSGARCAEPFCIQQPSCFGPRHLHGSAATKPRKLKREPVDILRSLPLLVAEPTAARSNSFVGTHEYLAPEIIKGEGHGSAVDWWTFGIFLYELLYGRTPFKGVGNEETLANVVMQSLKFPDSPLVSLHARDLITGLLVKEPEGRLGTLRGAAEIKQHPFFEGLNWALIRCAVPPELPESRNFGAGHAKGSSQDKYTVNNKYLEYNDSTGEHLEFEVF